MQRISTLLLAGACAPWVVSVQAFAPRFLWKSAPTPRVRSGCDAPQRLAATAAGGTGHEPQVQGRAKDRSNMAPDSPCPAGAPVFATPPLRDGAKDRVERGAYYDSRER